MPDGISGRAALNLAQITICELKRSRGVSRKEGRPSHSGSLPSVSRSEGAKSSSLRLRSGYFFKKIDISFQCSQLCPSSGSCSTHYEHLTVHAVVLVVTPGLFFASSSISLLIANCDANIENDKKNQTDCECYDEVKSEVFLVIFEAYQEFLAPCEGETTQHCLDSRMHYKTHDTIELQKATVS